MACFMCSGTDCAGSCDQGYCYAEEMQRRQEEEQAEQAYYEQLYEEQAMAAEAFGRFAVAIADTHPKDGDVKQAPLVSGGGSEGNRPNTVDARDGTE